MELLVVIFLISSLGTGLYTMGRGLESCYHRLQLEQGARQLALIVGELQHQAMVYEQGAFGYFIVKNNKQGFDYYEGTQLKSSVDLQNCGSVYIASGPRKMQFTTSGTPLYNGTYILKHPKVKKWSYQVVVQPVTGRVLLNEGS